MNVKFLVDNAIFSSLQDARFEPKINPNYAEFALSQVNFLLDEWRDNIPYASEVTFNNISSLLATTFVEVDTVQYVIISGGQSNAAFYLQSVSLNQYKQQQVLIGLNAFPNIYYFDQLLQRINIYPGTTQNNYQFIVRGRVGSLNLGMFDDIPANLPLFMQNALIYEIAFRLVGRYGADWDAKKEATKNGLLMQLENKKEIDLTPDIDIVFGTPGVAHNAPYPVWYYISGGNT